ERKEAKRLRSRRWPLVYSPSTARCCSSRGPVKVTPAGYRVRDRRAAAGGCGSAAPRRAALRVRHEKARKPRKPARLSMTVFPQEGGTAQGPHGHLVRTGSAAGGIHADLLSV